MATISIKRTTNGAALLTIDNVVIQLPIVTAAVPGGGDYIILKSYDGESNEIRFLYTELTNINSTPYVPVSVNKSIEDIANGVMYSSSAAITNYALETGGNLATVKTNTDKIPALGQALAAASVPVVLTAIQQTALTPPAAITNFANETGGNLATIKTNTDIPAAGGTIANANLSNVTATQIDATTHPCKFVIITAPTSNTGLIRIGLSGLTTTTGIELQPGESFGLPISNTNVLYGIAAVNAEDVSVIYLT